MKVGVILANALTLEHGQLSGKSFLISALYTDNEAAIRPLDLKVGCSALATDVESTRPARRELRSTPRIK